MKRIVTVVLVLFVLLVAAPWGIGRLAEKRVNDGLDKLVQQAPYLTIVERKWTSGWFRSEQEVTVEVFGAWMNAMNPKKVLDAANAAPEQDAAAKELADRKLSPLPGDATPDVEASDAQTPAPERLRFTVRNEILHGPVLWPASFGLARVNSRLVLSEKMRKELVEVFGTDEPARISHRVGFFGGGSTRLFGDGRTVHVKQDGGEVTYDDFELEVEYSSDFDAIDVDGSWPKLEFSSRNSGERLLLQGMSIEGDSERILGDVYDSDFEFEIDEMRFAGADKMETIVDDVHYIVDSEHQDGFLDLSAKFGSGKVSNPAFEEMQLDLKEIHYDFKARHLHIETLQKLIEALKVSYSRPIASVADVDAVVVAPMKEHALALLKHDPEFVIDRIGVVTADGAGTIKGTIRLQGVTEADFPLLDMGLLGKLVADITVEVAQKLVEKLPNGATGAGVAVDQGFAKRVDGTLVSRIEYNKGELLVNGKPVPIPGLGGPPASQDPFPAEAPPPQE